MVRNILFTMLLLCCSTGLYAQQDSTTSFPSEARLPEAFRAYLYNNEYNVYLRINFYKQDVTIPGQELYGPLPGYLGKQYNSFCWVITSCQNDSIYVLRQGTGNTIKVPNKGKWQKLPKTLTFKRR